MSSGGEIADRTGWEAFTNPRSGVPRIGRDAKGELAAGESRRANVNLHTYACATGVSSTGARGRRHSYRLNCRRNGELERIRRRRRRRPDLDMHSYIIRTG